MNPLLTMDATTPIRNRRGAGARFTVPLFRHKTLFLLIVLACGASSAALAHDPGLSAADLRFENDQLVAHLTFARLDIEPLLPRSDFLEVKVDGSPVAARQISTQFNSSNALEIWMRFPLQAGRCVAVRSPLLGDLAFGHRQYLAVLNSNGGVFTQQMLSASNDRVELSLSAVQPPSSPLSKSLVLGVEQMLAGHHHLAFLFGLSLMCGAFCSVVIALLGSYWFIQRTLF